MGNHCQSCLKSSDDFEGAEFKASKLEDVPTDSTFAKQSSVSIDPKALLFIQEKNRLLIRKVGTVQGHDFIIEECTDCRIYILDITAQVTIESCVNCSIFLAPCESSVSVRNCVNCELITVCSQLRLRDCKNLDIMLFCASSPCIETSTDVGFFGYQFAYFNLLKQMEDCNLSVFNNPWFKIHDFDTESPSKFEVKNNSVITRDVFPFIFSFILQDSIPEEIRDDLFSTEQTIIPMITGSVWDCEAEVLHPECLMFIIADREETALTVFHQIRAKMDRLSILVDTKLVNLDEEVL